MYRCGGAPHHRYRSVAIVVSWLLLARALRWLALLLTLSLLSACGRVVLPDGEGNRFAEIQALSFDARPRIAVAAVLDKSRGRHSLERHLGLVSESPGAALVLSGIGDMLIDALFRSGRFIVLEREGLDELFLEQALLDELLEGGGRVELGDAAGGELEGAELLLVAAISHFDPGGDGGVAFPIPIYLNRHNDLGLLDLNIVRSRVTMEIRIIEVRSGRVVASTAVEGRARSVEGSMSLLIRRDGWDVTLPDVLTAFANTPLEVALQRMVQAAVLSLVDSGF